MSDVANLHVKLSLVFETPLLSKFSWKFASIHVKCLLKMLSILNLMFSAILSQNSPSMYITTFLDDDRVPAWDSLKYVAKLRCLEAANLPANNLVLCRIYESGGHFGLISPKEDKQVRKRHYQFLIQYHCLPLFEVLPVHSLRTFGSFLLILNQYFCSYLSSLMFHCFVGCRNLSWSPSYTLSWA